MTPCDTQVQRSPSFNTPVPNRPRLGSNDLRLRPPSPLDLYSSESSIKERQRSETRGIVGGALAGALASAAACSLPAVAPFAALATAHQVGILAGLMSFSAVATTWAAGAPGSKTRTASIFVAASTAVAAASFAAAAITASPAYAGCGIAAKVATWAILGAAAGTFTVVAGSQPLLLASMALGAGALAGGLWFSVASVSHMSMSGAAALGASLGALAHKEVSRLRVNASDNVMALMGGSVALALLYAGLAL